MRKRFMHLFGMFVLMAFVVTFTSCEEDGFISSLRLAEGDNIHAFAGDQVYLHVEHTPSKADIPELVWCDYDPTIVWVFPSDNRIVVKKSGVSSLTIGTEDKSVTTKCVVNVSPIVLSLSDTIRTVLVEDTFSLIPTLTPERTPEKLTWTSSDKSVAKVDGHGKVEVVGVGECMITCEAAVKNVYESISDQCRIVSSPVKMTSLSLNETNCEIEIGKQLNLVASFEPQNATFTDLYWSSSDVSVATVDASGCVKAIKEGECVISVTNKDNTLEAQCQVSVFVVELTGMSCSEKKSLEVGESFRLQATCTPENYSQSCTTLYWVSSDESIAKVDKETGKVTGVSVGECTITIGNTYNDVTATCHITVLPILVKSLLLNKSSLRLFVGESEKLTYTVSPSTAMNKEVKWKSSNNSVVAVDEDGTVTAVGGGKARIIVRSQDGSGCSAECAVTVYASKEDYVQDYVENKISIKQTTVSSIIIGAWVQYSYGFQVDNTGDEVVYLKEVRGYGSSNGVVSINKQIAPGGSYSESFNTTNLDWVFEIDGVECTKRY